MNENDQTWTWTVPSKQMTVLRLTGNRQVVGLYSTNRDALFTADICISASGNFMAEMIASPRAKDNKQLRTMHFGSTMDYHPSG